MHEISTDITSDHNTILPYKTSKGKLNSYIRAKPSIDTTCYSRVWFIKYDGPSFNNYKFNPD